MKSAHAGFQLVEEEFTALVEDLVGALDKFNVPKKEKDEILARSARSRRTSSTRRPHEAAQHDAGLAKKATAKAAELRTGWQG